MKMQRYCLMIRYGEITEPALMSAENGHVVLYSEAQAEIDALKTAQTWQAIESAPRDARLVLLRVAHGSEWAGVHTAHWSASKHAWMYSPDYAVPNPTHWMPLPPAPETAK